MKITIVGGGNIGTQFAVHCAAKGHDVIVYTSKPEKFNNHLKIVDENNEIKLEADINFATSNERDAFGEAEVIFVTMPAYCMKAISEKIYPYAKSGMIIILVPGIGGGECFFKKCVEVGAVVSGLQRVPSVARLKVYGEIVCATGYREELFMAAIPNKYTMLCSEFVETIFDIKCTSMPNYLNVTLTPSNPILHTTRLKTMFEDYDVEKGYEYIPLFYEEWNNKSSELLLKCDEEVQIMCQAMKEFDLSYVKSLKQHYESNTAEQLTNKLSSIKSLKGLKTPFVLKEDRLHPDFTSRYFTADFPYGLSILAQIAKFLKCNVLNIDETLRWYEKLEGSIEGFDYSEFSIYSYEDLKKYYLQ